MFPTFVAYPIVCMTFFDTAFKAVTTQHHLHAAYTSTVFMLFTPDFIRCFLDRIAKPFEPNMKMETELIVNYMVLTFGYLYFNRRNFNHIVVALYSALAFNELFNNFEDNFIHRLLLIANSVSHIQYFAGILEPFHLPSAQWMWRICTYLQWIGITFIVMVNIYTLSVQWYELVCLFLLPLFIPSDSYTRVQKDHLNNGSTSLVLYDYAPENTMYLLTDVGFDMSDVIQRVREDRRLRIEEPKNEKVQVELEKVQVELEKVQVELEIEEVRVELEEVVRHVTFDTRIMENVQVNAHVTIKD